MRISRAVFSVVVLSMVVLGIGIGCDEDDDRPETQSMPVVLADSSFMAGRYMFCWDQKDRDGDQVFLDRSYAVEVQTTGGFSEFTSVRLSASNPSAGSPNCDTALGGGQLPISYKVELSDSAYAPGDTIGIVLDLPVADSVWMAVHEVGGI